MANNLVLSESLRQALDAKALAFCEQMPDGLQAGQVVAFLDTRGLTCPMPLLKAKIGLRELLSKQSLYLLANDPNSQTDLVAFCQKNHHDIIAWKSTLDDGGDVFHFIITKA